VFRLKYQEGRIYIFYKIRNLHTVFYLDVYGRETQQENEETGAKIRTSFAKISYFLCLTEICLRRRPEYLSKYKNVEILFKFSSTKLTNTLFM